MSQFVFGMCDFVLIERSFQNGATKDTGWLNDAMAEKVGWV